MRTAALTFCLLLFGCAEPIHQWSRSELNFAIRECMGREAGTPFRERFCNCEVNTLAANALFKDRELARNDSELTPDLRRCRTQLEDADPASIFPPASIQVEEPKGPRRRVPRRPPLEVDRNQKL